MDESRIEHLKSMQDVITRLATNSFRLKGWAVLLLSALFGLSAADSNRWFVLIAYLPTLMFWFLDAYYLRQERLFRKLFDHVRVQDGPSDWTMNTAPFTGEVADIGRTAVSQTLLPFYGVLLAATVAATIMID